MSEGQFKQVVYETPDGDETVTNIPIEEAETQAAGEDFPDFPDCDDEDSDSYAIHSEIDDEPEFEDERIPA